MNSSIEIPTSPPIKDDNYAKTASLLKVISEQENSEKDLLNDSFVSDINANEKLDHLGINGASNGRGAYIPYSEVI